MGALRQEAPERLAGRYELIRADVAGRGSVGQLLFRQRGLAAWLAEWCCSPGRPAAPRASTRPSAPPVPPPDVPIVSAEALTMAVASLVHTVVTGAAPC